MREVPQRLVVRQPFADRDEMERCYWDNRDALMADELLGHRPRTWWMFEAPLLCQHDPPCDLPNDSREQDDWLDRHDQLSAEERALLARTRPPPDAGRLEDDDG